MENVINKNESLKLSTERQIRDPYETSSLNG